MLHTKEEHLIRLLKGQESIIQQTYSILEEEEKKDDILRAVVLSTLKHHENHIPGLDPSRIFDIEDIRTTCVKYRLRFLPAGRFKGHLPNEAIYAIRQLEAHAGAQVRGFKIMAPAKRFKLCDCDSDPLLFVPVGAGSYYLVHQWGRELSPWRAVVGWPVRSVAQLIATVLISAAIIGTLTPTGWLTQDPGAGWWGGHRIYAFVSTALLFCAGTAFGWLAFFGQFSKEAWDSKTFN